MLCLDAAGFATLQEWLMEQALRNLKVQRIASHFVASVQREDDDQLAET